jgi:hypothetical protein
VRSECVTALAARVTDGLRPLPAPPLVRCCSVTASLASPLGDNSAPKRAIAQKFYLAHFIAWIVDAIAGGVLIGTGRTVAGVVLLSIMCFEAIVVIPVLRAVARNRSRKPDGA